MRNIYCLLKQKGACLLTVAVESRVKIELWKWNLRNGLAFSSRSIAISPIWYCRSTAHWRTWRVWSPSVVVEPDTNPGAAEQAKLWSYASQDVNRMHLNRTSLALKWCLLKLICKIKSCLKYLHANLHTCTLALAVNLQTCDYHVENLASIPFIMINEY